MPVIISTGGREQNRRLFAEHSVTAPVLLQEGDEVSSLYRIPGTPAGYLVDAEGAVAAPLAVGGEAVMALPGSARAAPAAVEAPPITRASPQSRLIRDGLRSGTPAPVFRLPRIDGGELSLADYRGRRVLLVFSDPGCAPCQTLAADLERIHRERPDLQVLMVSRSGLEANREKAAEHGLTFPIVLQRHWEISRQYGMFATPIAYLIDEEGTIAAEVAVGSEEILTLAGADRSQAVSAR
jgi:peroxiredoxin